MSLNHWFRISLGINILLLGFIAFSGRRTPGARTPSEVNPGTESTVRANHSPIPPQSKESVAQAIEVREPFHWSQLESKDYHAYVANLRAVGCPEPTVRDIIVADVNEMYRKRADEMVDAVQGRFWELMAVPEEFKKLVETKENELEATERERKDLLSRLLGNGGPWQSIDEDLNKLNIAAQDEQIFDYLPPEKAAQACAIVEKYRQSTPQFTIESEQARVLRKQRSHQELQQELAALLSPEELEEYRLRTSPAVEKIRSLAGFEATQAESRQIVSLMDAYGDTNSQPSSLQTNLKQLLGEERFVEFDRAQDARYLEFYQVTDRLDLPEAAATQAVEIRTQAEEAARKIRADSTIPADLKNQQLLAIQSETENALGSLLGDKGLKLYQQSAGAWISQLPAGH